MLEITATDSHGTVIRAYQRDERYGISLTYGGETLPELAIYFNFEELATFAKELAGATALWGIIRASELQDAPTGGEVSRCS